MIDRERFFSHVEIQGDCWIWTGALRDDGRARFFMDYNEVLAHHAAFELRFEKPVPKGWQLKRECRNEQCVRHWVLRRPHTKLTSEAAALIRQGHHKAKALAQMLGVGKREINKVRQGTRRA